MIVLNVSGREATSQLVRWCPEAKTWQPADEPTCHWEHAGFDYISDSHRLRLRRMLVCKQCEQAYCTKISFEDHECFSAY